jgi:hypothetical protein
VRRRHWPRQLGNDGVVRVLVPLSEAAPEGNRGNRNPPHRPAPASGPDITQVIRETIESVVAPLAAQIEHERRRADDAIAAERIAALETAGLRAQLDQERRRSAEMFSQLTANVERADRAARLLEAEQQRSDKLQTSLGDAVGAERIAAGEAAALARRGGPASSLASTSPAMVGTARREIIQSLISRPPGFRPAGNETGGRLVVR